MVRTDTDVWAQDWRAKAYAALHKKGFRNFVEFARAAPGATFREFATELDDFVAPAQVEQLLREDAERVGDFAYFACTVLVRYLRQRLPQGWGEGLDFEFRLSFAFASWSTALGEYHKDVVDGVWVEINRDDLGIPRGWLPADTNDEIMVKLFRSAGY